MMKSINTRNDQSVIRWIITAAALLVPLGVALGEQDSPQPAIGQHYAKAKAALVEVLVNGRLEGSGWMVDPKGALLTAGHVVGRPGMKIEVTSPAIGRIEAKVAAVDLGHDLALLAVAPRKEDYPTLSLAAKPPAVGDELFVLGSPIFRHAVLARGILARPETAYEYYADRYNEVLHVAATVPSGMSGGPWLNASGEVVGVQSAVMSLNAIPIGIAFAGPLDAIRGLLNSRKTAATPNLGAAVEEVWQQDRKTADRFPPQTEGLVVKSLKDDGPAARAGLRPIDLVIAVDGKKVRLVDELLRVVCGKQPGQTVELTVVSPDGAGQRKVVVPLGKLEVAWP